MKAKMTLLTATVSCCLSLAQGISAAELSFTPVQADEFAVKGSLSNAWGDYDGDGDLDFLVSIKGGELRLYRNDEGTLVGVGAELGLPQSGDQLRGVSWGDIDNDGDLDIVAGSNEYPMPSRSYVYLNEGNAFIESAEKIGLTIPGRISRQTNLIDYDNDGDLDVYAANRMGPNQLLQNVDGKFKPLGFAAGMYDSRRTVGACWFDIDNDRDLDLFLANQSGDSDGVLRNDGERFVDIAPELGMDETLRSSKIGGVGCAVGDYNNDGFLDLYVATYGENLLYHNNGDGTFSELGKAMKVQDPDHTVAAAWGDYDNDGWLDLIAVGYHRVNGQSVPFGKLYHNEKGLTFKEDTRFEALTTAGDHGVEWIDYDNDGDLDLSVTDGYGDEGGHFVFKNELEADARSNMLAVMVLDHEGHYTQQGAEVRFYTPEGDILGTRMVSTGGGYNAQSARPVYFASPSNDLVTVKVTFMGKSKPVEVTVKPSDLNGQSLVVYRAKE